MSIDIKWVRQAQSSVGSFEPKRLWHDEMLRRSAVSLVTGWLIDRCILTNCTSHKALQPPTTSNNTVSALYSGEFSLLDVPDHIDENHSRRRLCTSLFDTEKRTRVTIVEYTGPRVQEDVIR